MRLDESRIRVRMSGQDAHYAGELVDGARILMLFGDVATELLIRHDGDEGLFRAYEEVEFLAPVYAGDYVEAVGKLVGAGRTSRRMEFEAYKVIEASRDSSSPSVARVLPDKILVCRARGTCVVPAERQRGPAQMKSPLIITAAICGAEVMKRDNPAVPYTTTELAAEAERCFREGARVIHLHVRRPDGTPTQDKEVFREAMEAIHARVPDVIIQVSTGGAVGMGVQERAQVLELGPEFCTLTTGTVNFGDEVFQNDFPTIRSIARKATENGVRVEIEVFDAGFVDNAMRLVREGVLETPLHFDFVLGVPGGMTGTEDRLDFLLDTIPEGSTWMVAGIGRFELPLARAAIIRGGHVRVGLEDNIYVSKGVLAKGSFELVREVRKYADEAGRPLASPEEARDLLHLPQRPR